MKDTRTRFIVVGVAVCFFAIGMATFLNYYKYKSTFGRVVQSRLLVIGYGIDSSIQSSLGLGLSFGELGMLPSLLEREKASDELITGIDIFGADGKLLYSSDPSRVGSPVPAPWLEEALQSRAREWQSASDAELVAGIALKNNFDLTVGYLALRYTRDYVDRELGRMRAELLTIGVTAFLIASLVAALALAYVLRRYERDMKAIRDRIAGQDATDGVAPAFAPAVEGLRDSLRDAEAGLAKVRAGLERA